MTSVIYITDLELSLRQWAAGNIYLLVLSGWKVNIAKNPIAKEVVDTSRQYQTVTLLIFFQMSAEIIDDDSSL